MDTVLLLSRCFAEVLRVGLFDMSTKATNDGICDFDRLRHSKPVGAQAYWRGGGCPLRRCYQPRIPGPFNISSSDGGNQAANGAFSVSSHY
jgi:hypothetical protein